MKDLICMVAVLFCACSGNHTTVYEDKDPVVKIGYFNSSKFYYHTSPTDSIYSSLCIVDSLSISDSNLVDLALYNGSTWRDTSFTYSTSEKFAQIFFPRKSGYCPTVKYRVLIR